MVVFLLVSVERQLLFVIRKLKICHLSIDTCLCPCYCCFISMVIVTCHLSFDIRRLINKCKVTEVPEQLKSISCLPRDCPSVGARTSQRARVKQLYDRGKQRDVKTLFWQGLHILSMFPATFFVVF